MTTSEFKTRHENNEAKMFNIALAEQLKGHRVAVMFFGDEANYDEVIEKLREEGVDFEVGEDTNYNTTKLPVRMDYLDDIDIAEFREIPTYKRMCVCIMKNDHLCKYMGFSKTKNEEQRRKEIMDKYNNML